MCQSSCRFKASKQIFVIALLLQLALNRGLEFLLLAGTKTCLPVEGLLLNEAGALSAADLRLEIPQRKNINIFLLS